MTGCPMDLDREDIDKLCIVIPECFSECRLKICRPGSAQDLQAQESSGADCGANPQARTKGRELPRGGGRRRHRQKRKSADHRRGWG